MTCPVPTMRSLGILMLSAFLLGGCLPSPQSQSDEEKEYHYLAGKNRINAMDFKGAVAAFEKALESNPHSAAAHFELGLLFDQEESDPAAAVYHYSQYLKLKEDAHNTETVKLRIMACKQQLARSVSFGPVTQVLQREYEQLKEVNQQLTQERDKWQAAYQALEAQVRGEAQRAPATQPGGTGSARNGALSTPGGVVVTVMTNPNRGPTTSRTTPPSTAGSRTHTVKSGETLSAIAREYGVDLGALKAANPRLEPRRMQVGTRVMIPSS